MPKLADIYTCSGCLACVESCNHGALYSRWNNEGHLTYGFIENQCVNCHLCERSCPAINGYQYGDNNLSLSVVYAAWSKDETLRARSTSGGVFASLAATILKRGGVVVGASMQNNNVKHVVIDNLDDLNLIQGSKYAQSDTTGIYQTVLGYLKSGVNVLFSGLGCQVAGLLNYLPRNKQYENLLYTIDLICGGVPSRFIISKYLDHESSWVKEIHAYRNKAKYEFSVVDKDGIIKVVPLSHRPLPLCGFYTELTNKHICYDCRYVGAHRKSDITIGDYWGDVEFPGEHKNGLSITIAHSEKIKELLHKSNITLHEVKWEQFLMHNTRMVYGKNILGGFRRRKRLSEAIEKDSYEKFVIDYANGATLSHPFYYIRKIAIYLYCRLKSYKQKHFVEELLSNGLKND